MEAGGTLPEARVVGEGRGVVDTHSVLWVRVGSRSSAVLFGIMDLA